MQHPKVTVLMALYNGGKYLPRSIKSVLDQTYKDFEFLIVNDCSTDDSVKVVEAFNDSRVRIHHNQENLGQTRSLNVGLELAKGQWIARMDADDFALKHWLEKQMIFVNQHPDYAVVSADAIVIDEHDQIKKKYLSPVLKDEIVLRSFFNSPINHVGCVMNKRIVLDLGGYDEKYWTVADYDLWRKLICNDYKMTSLGEVCVVIRRHGASLSFQDLDNNYFDQIAEITSSIVLRYTHADVDQGEMSLLIRSLYCPEKVESDEFERSINILKMITDSILVDKITKKKNIKSWSKGYMRNLILKRIQVLILKKEYKAVRPVALKGIEKLGAFNSFSYFVFASYFNGLFLDFVPNLYNKFLKYRVMPSAKSLIEKGNN